MIEIIFQKDDDAHRLYGHMINQVTAEIVERGHVQLDKNKKRIRILPQKLPKADFHKIKESVYNFIVVKKRDDWFREILANRFFYKDPNEQEQILQIIYSVIDGSREDLASFLSGPDEKGYALKAIHEMFNSGISFSFDSFVMFRLRPFHDRLYSYVEVAIDEYKLEQDYQMFVQTLREFLSAREAKQEVIHLLLDEETTFHDKNLNELKRSELIKGIDRRLLGNHPLYIDSVTIAPLLSIAPTQIFLYTNQPEQPLVRTIRNIFEERINICPVKVFAENKKNMSDKSNSPT
ncbi:sporulation protein YtxC [Bacillus sp. B15-48]|uniref:sporulation protein YtxC n=1 Tax=Bacillus sp. B15-48 TaxID=1548601 RepID=UPI00193FE7A0|nr:sporulation protein YtxC [Bacillus sp. B15-48]MBM4762515.1 putative sporulation protein YtxC [Bacillus sp. B15-48]